MLELAAAQTLASTPTVAEPAATPLAAVVDPVPGVPAMVTAASALVPAERGPAFPASPRGQPVRAAADARTRRAARPVRAALAAAVPAVVLAAAVMLRVVGGGPWPSYVSGGAPPAPTVAGSTPKPVSDPTRVAAVARTGAVRATRVVIISEDGMRRDVLNDEHAPRHAALMREGMVARRALTIRQSETLPSHASMLSGVGPEVHGIRWNRFRKERGHIDVPTVFSVARAHGLSTAMIIGKQKLEHLAKPGTVDHYERPSHYCRRVSIRAAEYFTEARPDIMFVHFSDPDDAGHSKGWMTPAYYKAVRQSDACLARLLAAIDASGLGESTLIIVTSDHGGHARTHSNGRAHREVDQVIPWIVRGPGVAPGTVLADQVDTMDTAVTALGALRLPSKGMSGVSRLPVSITR